MTPYELVDLAQSAFSNSIASYAIFLSVTTGYLVTTYMVGAELSQTQVRLLTVLFLFVVTIVTWGTSAYVYWGTRYSDLARPDDVERMLMSPQPWLPALVAIGNLFIVAGCLAFMWNVRHPKQTGG